MDIINTVPGTDITNTVSDKKYANNDDGVSLTFHNEPYTIYIAGDEVAYLNGRKFVSVEALQMGLTVRSEKLKKLSEQNMREYFKHSIFTEALLGSLAGVGSIVAIVPSFFKGDALAPLSDRALFYVVGAVFTCMGALFFKNVYRDVLILRQLDQAKTKM